MILSNNLTQKTHYEILGVKEDAKHEEIRTSYRLAILNFHPDKVRKTSEASNLEHESDKRFLEVQTAWRILGDPRSRALYDNEIRLLRQDALTAEDITLEDLTIEETGDVCELFHNCRCGDYFSVDSLELADMGCTLLRNGGKIYLQSQRSVPTCVILPCGSCSLKVRLLIDEEISVPTELSN